MCFGSIISKGATEARTWIMLYYGSFREGLVSFCFSSSSLAGVGRSIAFLIEIYYRESCESQRISPISEETLICMSLASHHRYRVEWLDGTSWESYRCLRYTDISEVPWLHSSFCDGVKCLSNIERPGDEISLIVPDLACEVCIDSRISIAVWWYIWVGSSAVLSPVEEFLAGCSRSCVLCTVIFPFLFEGRIERDICNAKFLIYRIWKYRYSDDTLESTLWSIGIFWIIRTLHERCRKEEEIFLFVPDECSRIRENFRRWASITKHEWCFLFWIFYIRYIIEIDLKSTILYTSPRIRLRIISKSDEAILIVGMEIRRVPGNLQLTEDLRGCRRWKIDDEKWINLFECNQIKSIPDKSCRLEILSWSDICDLSDDFSKRRYRRARQAGYWGRCATSDRAFERGGGGQCA